MSSGKATKPTPKAGISKATRRRQKKLTRTHSTFICAKIKVEASTNSMEELHKRTKDWFNHLKQADKDASIYPFKDAEPTSAFMLPNEIPDSFAPFRNFFHNATLTEREGHVWVNMIIGHNESIDEIMNEMNNYKNQTDSFTYVKKLQTRYVSKEYFLLWSTDYIDTARLTKVLNEKIAKKTKKNITLHLRGRLSRALAEKLIFLIKRTDTKILI